jgi:hypothetical protein
MMRKFLIALPIMALIGACSNKESLEEQGQQAGATADQAVERAENRIDAEKAKLDLQTALIREKARDVKQDVKDGLDKVDNAANAAEAELKK